MGTSPKNGNLSSTCWMSSRIKPPMATVWPSQMVTAVPNAAGGENWHFDPVFGQGQLLRLTVDDAAGVDGAAVVDESLQIRPPQA